MGCLKNRNMGIKPMCNMPLRAYRHAAKRAVEIMDDKLVMDEDFVTRPYSPEKACIA